MYPFGDGQNRSGDATSAMVRTGEILAGDTGGAPCRT
jgi:hypothetical protein